MEFFGKQPIPLNSAGIKVINSVIDRIPFEVVRDMQPLAVTTEISVSLHSNAAKSDLGLGSVVWCPSIRLAGIIMDAKYLYEDAGFISLTVMDLSEVGDIQGEFKATSAEYSMYAVRFINRRQLEANVIQGIKFAVLFEGSYYRVNRLL